MLESDAADAEIAFYYSQEELYHSPIHRTTDGLKYCRF